MRWRLQCPGVCLAVVAACGALPAGASSAPAARGALRGSVVTNGTVEALARLGSRVFLGGSFAYVGPVTGPGVGVDVISGRVDGGSARLEGRVDAVLGDGAGGFFVGGSLLDVRHHRRVGLLHILPTGGVDPDFSSSARPAVQALALGNDRLYAAVGGSLGSVGNPHIVAVDPRSGAVDPTFSVALVQPPLPVPSIPAAPPPPPTAPCAFFRYPPLHVDGGVLTMTVSANRLYLGGRFSQVDGVPRENLAAVDASTGQLDRSFDAASSNPGPLPSGRTRLADADEPVRSLALAGGHLVVGGHFGAIGARRRAGLAAVRLDSGAVDETFAPGPTSGGRGVLVAAGDRLYVSRYIGSVELAAIDPVTGSRVPGFKAPENLWVHDLALVGNRLVVAANSGPALSRIRVVDALTGKSDKRFDVRVGGWTVKVAASQNHLYAGGGFASAGGESRAGLAAIDARTGALDQRFRPAGDYVVHGMIASSGRLYVSGAHWRTSATAARGGGSPRRRRTSGLNALNPITGRRYASFQAPLSWAGAAVAVLGDTVYATDFPARLSAFDARTGAQRRAFHAQLPGSVVALAAARHRLYAGLSAVATPLGLPIPGVVAVDPATGRPDPTFAPGLRAIAPAAGTRALALTRDTLYVSGDFSSSRLGPATVALDPRTGERRPGFGRRLMASALTVDQHQLYAATTNANGDYRLVKLPPSPGRPHTALTGFDGPVCALVGVAGRLYAGGAFDSIAGQPVPNFAGLSLQTLHYL